MSQITITFDEEKDIHVIDVTHCNIQQVIMAYQSLEELIEEKTGMPMEASLAVLSLKEGK